MAKAFSTIAHFFETGGKLPALEAEPQSQEEESMDKEQYATLMGKLDTIEEKQSALEGNQTEFAKQLKNPAANTDDEPNVADDKDKPKPTGNAGVTAEQFSALMGKVDNVLTKQGELDTQFSELKNEVPGQRNAGEGADVDNQVEAI
ncbi:Probable capsid scaffolding protein [Moritella viscosa]|uniref:Probable capsid scaffolding protein n=1 Tax=Moritella viscosa TaxID=80854 RepID=A0ABY1HM27_9GAMM|nr:Probable capsid scaffolding protein [Moritella viscosa]